MLKALYRVMNGHVAHVCTPADRYGFVPWVAQNKSGRCPLCLGMLAYMFEPVFVPFWDLGDKGSKMYNLVVPGGTWFGRVAAWAKAWPGAEQPLGLSSSQASAADAPSRKPRAKPRAKRHAKHLYGPDKPSGRYISSARRPVQCTPRSSS